MIKSVNIMIFSLAIFLYPISLFPRELPQDLNLSSIIYFRMIPTLLTEHSVPRSPNNGKTSETIELLLPCGYLSSPQKPNMMILIVKYNFFKNIHFLVLRDQLPIFPNSQNPDPKSWKSSLCSKRSPVLGLSPGAIWDATDFWFSSNDRLKKKSWGSTDRASGHP